MHNTFKYVSYALGDVRLRNHITTIQNFPKLLKDKDFECYRSLFRFDVNFYEWVTRNKTVAGFRGDCWLDYFAIDIDDPKDHANALVNAKKLASFLKDKGIICAASFSGNKGFHLIFPFTLDIEPSYELPAICKSLAKFIAQESDVKIDLQIYEINRLLRLVNTQHKKSKLFKIPLTSTELNTLDIDAIKELAGKPRLITLSSDISSDGKYLEDLYDKYQHTKSFKKEHFQDRLPCYHALLQGVEEGERDAAGLRLACYFQNKQLDQSMVEKLMKDWNQRNRPPLPESEIANSIVAPAFIHKYTYGCKDEVLAKYCNANECPLIKKSKQIPSKIRVFNIQEAIDHYYSWIQDYGKFEMTLGLPAIDQCIRLFPGVLIQVLGTTSVGKTALVMNILYHLNKNNYPSLLISLEQAEQMITERFLQRSLRKDSMKLTDTFSNYGTAREAALKAASKMSNVFICDESVVTVESTKLIVNEVYNKYGKRLSVVAIDYVQLMKGSSGSRYDKMTEIAQAEKRIAKDLGIVLISLSQIGRKLKSTDPVTLNTAKETGQIEEGADILLGVWQRRGKENVIAVDMLKNKTGKDLASCNIMFEKDLMLMQEYSNLTL